jgi:hypothetical protein
MGMHVTIYTPNFIKIGLGIQKLIRRREIHSHTGSMEIT